MPEALGPILMGSTLAGVGGNIYGDVEAGKTAGLQQQQMKNELSYQNDPAKFAKLVQSFMVPLSNALVQSVTRGADASGAAAGLSDSPGLMAYIVSQALAPSAQQEQQTAAGEASNVAFPPGMGSPQFPQSNLSGNFAQLAKLYPNIFGGGGSPAAAAATGTGDQNFMQGLGAFGDYGGGGGGDSSTMFPGVFGQ